MKYVALIATSFIILKNCNSSNHPSCRGWSRASLDWCSKEVEVREDWSC
jgi:hypothetical protein